MPEDQADPEFDRGFQLRCEGRYAEAKAAFASVLARYPGHMGARHQVALIKGFEGDFDGSLADLQQLVGQSPNNTTIRYDLAMTQLMLGMNDEACSNLREVLRIDPTHENALRQSAYC